VPYFRDALAILRDICPDYATPEWMELSARLGSLMPCRKAADVIAEFLPGYAGRGEISGLLDGAEIMKRLPRNLPRRTGHVVDWFLTSIVDYGARHRSGRRIATVLAESA
jgi:hypothetical protein